MILLIFAKFIDKVDPRILMPICLLLRALCFQALFMCKDPKGLLFKIVGPLSHSCFSLVVVSFMSFYTKMFPKEIRGILENFTGI